MSELARHLRRTTEKMACSAKVDMSLWNEHSNACLDSANAVERLEAERDALRAELAAVRKQHDANGKASRDRAEHIYKVRTKLNAAEAERDALRAALERIADTDPDEGTAWFHSVANAALNKGGLMSDAEIILVAWMHAHGMHDSAGLVERLAAERDALRANLRDELERADAWHKTFLQTQKHNEELRELLREAREWIVEGKVDFNDALADRINAALRGDGDE